MNSRLGKELLQMTKRDQDMRLSGRWDWSVDKTNTRRLKKIVKNYGWPDIDLVGEKASHGAWLIAQHADHDIKFQEKCLSLITVKLKDGKAHPQNYAYLVDRVRKNKGLTQIYGTQFYLKNKKLVPWPIKDKKSLDKRRKKFKLGSFRKYQRNLLKRQTVVDKG